MSVDEQLDECMKHGRVLAKQVKDCHEMLTLSGVPLMIEHEEHKHNGCSPRCSLNVRLAHYLLQQGDKGA